MRKALIILIAIAFAAGLVVQSVMAHCQIPCGIYGDDTRFKQLNEHITTIEKSMKLIADLSDDKQPNHNQLARWVMNKEKHADEFTEIVTYYFMAQRVKPAPEGDKKAEAKYVKQVTLLHHMIVHAMKAKQTTDLAHVATLRGLVKKFETAYHGH